MATNKKITELTELTGADKANDDVLAIVDISAGTTHKIKKSTFTAAVAGVTSLEATSPIARDTASGDVTVSISATPSFTSVSVTGDTSAGDDAKIGYTSAEGLILTGQGSTNDVTIKNDADADVITIATGATNVDIVGDVTASTVNADGDTAANDGAAMGYTSAEGLILTGQGSTNEVTIKKDADADVITIATGATNVDIVGDVTASTVNADGDTAANDGAAMGYTSAEGLILTGQGSTNDVTIKNDADEDVLEIPTGTKDVTVAGKFSVAGDTASGDDATIGYTSAEGLILTGQGSTNDITIKNDADGEVCGVPTGTDDLRFPDNAKAEWGTGGDLQIYHDASNSYINDAGTGNLKIAASQIDLLGGTDGAETMATFADDGAATLYYDNSSKFATTTVGATVSGTLIATTDTDTSNTGNVTLDFAANQNFVLTFTGNVTLDNPSTEQVGQSGIIVCIQDGTGSRTLSLGTDYETAAAGGITLSTAGGALDIIPYFVSASARIQLGAVQLAFS